MTERARRLEPDQRRRQILRSAIELFGERSYASVSTAELADQAGVGRGLIHHYFGTKRELYLEVVRSMVEMAPIPAGQLPTGPLPERIDDSMNRFLDLISKDSKTWLAVIGAEGLGPDDEVATIIHTADRHSADLLATLLGINPGEPDRDLLVTMIQSWGGLAKAGGRSWLQSGTLTRAQLHDLLCSTLQALVEQTWPNQRNRRR